MKKLYYLLALALVDERTGAIGLLLATAAATAAPQGMFAEDVQMNADIPRNSTAGAPNHATARRPIEDQTGLPECVVMWSIRIIGTFVPRYSEGPVYQVSHGPRSSTEYLRSSAFICGKYSFLGRLRWRPPGSHQASVPTALEQRRLNTAVSSQPGGRRVREP